MTAKETRQPWNFQTKLVKTYCFFHKKTSKNIYEHHKVWIHIRDINNKTVPYFWFRSYRIFSTPSLLPTNKHRLNDVYSYISEDLALVFDDGLRKQHLMVNCLIKYPIFAILIVRWAFVNTLLWSCFWKLHRNN